MMVIKIACVKRSVAEGDEVELCIRVVLRCCNDYAYIVSILCKGELNWGIGVYKDDWSRDFIVWAKGRPECISKEVLEDMLLEASAKLEVQN